MARLQLTTHTPSPLHMYGLGQIGTVVKQIDLLFYRDLSVGHNHVITLARKEEEPQRLLFWDLQQSWVFDGV